jgi:hypothetical protein
MLGFSLACSLQLLGPAPGPCGRAARRVVAGSAAGCDRLSINLNFKIVLRDHRNTITAANDYSSRTRMAA